MTKRPAAAASARKSRPPTKRNANPSVPLRPWAVELPPEVDERDAEKLATAYTVADLRRLIDVANELAIELGAEMSDPAGHHIGQSRIGALPDTQSHARSDGHSDPRGAGTASLNKGAVPPHAEDPVSGPQALTTPNEHDSRDARSSRRPLYLRRTVPLEEFLRPASPLEEERFPIPQTLTVAFAHVRRRGFADGTAEALWRYLTPRHTVPPKKLAQQLKSAERALEQYARDTDIALAATQRRRGAEAKDRVPQPRRRQKKRRKAP